ncbi:MBL fold metallo-hydrolase [Geobacter sp. OR-1]|uniref:MBL fold metallo-hydrolase n=1 Tax=Geobacter sp. OR-1 TaxID=1266765 RepID=UPI0005A7DAD1|nr:MBL fold metallo-hydrolase [Geobacter sp. OR-1]
MSDLMETLVVGSLGVNCLVIDCGNGDGIVVDPGAEPGRILDAVKRRKLNIVRVINTHGHFDHIGGNKAVLEATGAKLMVHAADEPQLARAVEVSNMYGLKADNSPLPDKHLEDGMVINVGTTAIRVIHTPGHTPGGCSLYLADRNLVITGDTLFADSVGRTDLPGGSHEALITSIKNKLFTLPDDTVVIPGHGPSTTIGREKRDNEWLK